MFGYRNAVYSYKTQSVELHTWTETGDRIVTSIPFEPYFFYEDETGTDTSIFDTKLRKKSFKNSFDRNKFIKERDFKQVFDTYNPVQQCLIDLFWDKNDTEDFVKFPLKIYFVDIEAVGKNGFSTPEDPNDEINVITVYDSLKKKYFVWGLKPYNNIAEDVEYVYCKTESLLLAQFLEFMQDDPCEVLSGWSSERYDVPYITNRIERILGKDAADMLSPYRRRYTKKFAGKFGKEEIVHRFDGMSSVDYMDVYKKFCPVNRESYKLNYIGEVELKESKVDYTGMTLWEFMETDWDTFVDYNIQDVRLLVKLEEKLKYIELLRMLAYMGCATFESALGTVGVVTGAAAIEARKKGKRLATFVVEDDNRDFEGGFVSEPLAGHHKSVISFDANSLYPNTMITLNTSQETKMGVIEYKDEKNIHIRNVDGVVLEMNNLEFSKFVKTNKIAISKSGVLFTQKKKGILADMVDVYYKKRVSTRKELYKVSLEYEKTKDPSTYNKKQFLDTKQHALKIFINSSYGATSNPYCALFDKDIAESITLTGQGVIKEAREIFKRFIKNKTNITNESELEMGLIAGDTDSVIYDTIINTNIGKISIGELFDTNFGISSKINKKDIEYTDNGHEMINVSGLYCDTYNSFENKVYKGKVKRLVRHKVSKGKYKIKVNGKEIIMTEDHGCMVVRDGNLIRVCPKEILKTDKMVCLN